MGHNPVTGEQAKSILLDLCFRHPAIVSEDYGKQDARHNAEVQCFIYEALEESSYLAGAGLPGGVGGGSPSLCVAYIEGYLAGHLRGSR